MSVSSCFPTRRQAGAPFSAPVHLNFIWESGSPPTHLPHPTTAAKFPSAAPLHPLLTSLLSQGWLASSSQGHSVLLPATPQKAGQWWKPPDLVCFPETGEEWARGEQEGQGPRVAGYAGPSES